MFYAMATFKFHKKIFHIRLIQFHMPDIPIYVVRACCAVSCCLFLFIFFYYFLGGLPLLLMLLLLDQTLWISYFSIARLFAFKWDIVCLAKARGAFFSFFLIIIPCFWDLHALNISAWKWTHIHKPHRSRSLCLLHAFWYVRSSPGSSRLKYFLWIRHHTVVCIPNKQIKLTILICNNNLTELYFSDHLDFAFNKKNYINLVYDIWMR